MSTITKRLCAALLPLLVVSVTACGDSDISAQNNGGNSTAPDAWTPGTQSEADAGSADGTAGTIGPKPVEIETSLQKTTLRAGASFRVECRLLDASGNRVRVEGGTEFGLNYTPRDHFESLDSQTLEPQLAGDGTIACKAPSLGLVDRSPVEVTIEPGAAHTVRTELGEERAEAGTSVSTQCRVYDAFGNRIEGASPTVQVDAMGGGISVDTGTVTIETAGIYMVHCRVSGADRELGEALEVRPGRPAKLTLTPKPSRSVYGLEQVVHFETLVTDRYGNRVPQADVQFQSQPQAANFGYGRYKFGSEGSFEVTATVQGKTHQGKNLSESVQIVVNGEGPDIRCKQPSPATVLDRNPGNTLTFRGTVDDPNGIKKLTINGQTTQVGSNGSFQRDIEPEFGINFVDIVAEDSYDEQNSRTCAFLVADEWTGARDHLGDGVSMRLDQDAVDDDDRNDGLDSIADLIDRALTSDGVKEEIGRALLNANPLRDKCEQDTFAGCIASSKVTYRASGGNPDAGLQLEDLRQLDLQWTRSGLELSASIEKLGIKLKAKATGAGLISVDETGWVRANQVDIDFDTKLELKNDRLHASVRDRSVRVDVPRQVNLDFGGGLSGLLVSAVENLFQGQIRSVIESQFENYIKNNLDPALDDLFSSLSVDSIGRTVRVPKLAGGGKTAMQFGVEFSSLDTRRGRGIVGIGPQFTTSNVQRSGSRGAPLQRGQVLLEPSTNRPLAVGVHVGVVNQVLHTLWRAGMFDANLGKSLLGSSVPKGTKAELKLDLPPVAKRHGSKNQIDLMLGGATLTLVYPGIFDKPVDVRVGLVARTSANIQNSDTLKFDKIRIVDFYFSPRDISLSPKTRSTIESFLKGLFQNVVDRSLNSSLPSLPIPSFEIPASLGRYNLPTGRKLGLDRPGIDTVRHHFLLEGGFGLQ